MLPCHILCVPVPAPPVLPHLPPPGLRQDLSAAIAFIMRHPDCAAPSPCLRQDLSAAIAFIVCHPDCALHIAVLSVVTTISQFFISYTIKTATVSPFLSLPPPAACAHKAATRRPQSASCSPLPPPISPTRRPP
ncbi:unnamed protein product [Closterium sp. NIES-64]|nr:unnamed protein product [Closterium sp. NIES-64]